MTRRILAIFIALVLAVGGAFAILFYVNSADARALAGKQAVTVLVATDRIPAGTTGEQIRALGLVEAVQMPASSVPDDAMSAIDKKLDELTVTSDVAPRQLLLRGAFGADTRKVGGLSIPEGKLAVTVELEPVREVAGYVRPGSQIAIFDTYTPAKSGETEGDETTRVLLPRVEVIAVGAYGADGVTSTQERQQTSSDEEGKGRTSGKGVLVTVAVNQNEAERLVHAYQTGQLYMALLTESSDVRPGSGVNNRSLF